MYVKKLNRKSYKNQTMVAAIMFVFFAITILISLLPAYFAMLPLAGS